MLSFHAPGRLTRRLARDRRGVAALEFALLAPVMILLFFGMSELASAITAGRHTNHASAAVGDLVAQCANINNTDLANMTSAASDILAPLPVSTTLLNLRVTSVVVTDSKGTTQSQWSYAPSGQSGLTAYPTPTSITLPPNLVSAQGDSVIMSEATYNFNFPINIFSNLFKFSDVSYFKPRKSTQVVWAANGTSCYS